MKKILIFTCLFIILTLNFFSCTSSDEPTYNSNMQDYFPMKVGNWWLYDNYYLDSLGNRVIKSFPDTVIITGIDTINGKTCYVFSHQNSFGSYHYTIVDKYFIDGSKLYHLENPSISNNSTDSNWYLLADLKKLSWTMYDLYDTLSPGDYFSISHIRALVVRNYDSTLIYKGNPVRCISFTKTYISSHNVRTIEGDTIEYRKRNETTYLYVKDIGLINQRYMIKEYIMIPDNYGTETILTEIGNKNK